MKKLALKERRNMKRRIRSTLVQSAESLTPNEMFLAPELPTLMALDANLLAAIRLLEFQNPYCQSRPDNRKIADGVEEHIADSICLLANALRKNLSAYYAAILESHDEYGDQQEEPF
jgi:hypothetical protein